ncbi:MAG: chorismate mutase [Methanomethylophilus sp.]|jgi:chorismate mutase
MDAPASTKELRDEVSEIDSKIIDLIATRIDITDELAQAKKRSKQSYWDEAKEKEIVAKYRELCTEVSLTPEEAEQIAHVILSISKARQKKIYDGD